MRHFALVVCFAFLIGCEQPNLEDPLIQRTINDFDAIEEEILKQEKIAKTNARDRIYERLFHEQDTLLHIARGGYNPHDSEHNYLVCAMAWVTLGELQKDNYPVEISIEEVNPNKPMPEPVSEKQLEEIN